MDQKKVLAHTCFQRGKGFAKDTPLSPKKCRCRQYVTVAEAAAEVALGMAQYVVVIDKMIEVEEVCDICGAVDILKKSCQNCGQTGIVKRQTPLIIRGEDINLSCLCIMPSIRRYRSNEKSPTIEKAHIERAYVDGNQAEQARIEEYGASVKDFVSSLISGYEPEDDPIGIGRTYDYGRNL